MMQRRILRLIAVAAISSALTAGAACAGSRADDIVAQLKQQGYVDLHTETTWLGRSRITGRTADGSREIVLNPNTGEILRDLWTPNAGGGEKEKLISDTNQGSGSGSGTSGGGSNGGDDGSDDHHGDGNHDGGEGSGNDD